MAIAFSLQLAKSLAMLLFSLCNLPQPSILILLSIYHLMDCSFKLLMRDTSFKIISMTRTLWPKHFTSPICADISGLVLHFASINFDYHLALGAVFGRVSAPKLSSRAAGVHPTALSSEETVWKQNGPEPQINWRSGAGCLICIPCSVCVCSRCSYALFHHLVKVMPHMTSYIEMFLSVWLYGTMAVCRYWNGFWYLWWM